MAFRHEADHPAQFWGNPQGVADRRSVSGFFVADRRIFSSAAITVDGERPIPVSYSQLGEDASQLLLLPRNLEEEGVDPRVALEAVNRVSGDSFDQRIRVRNSLTRRLKLTVAVVVGLDMGSVQEVKGGIAGPGPEEISLDPLTARRGEVKAAFSQAGTGILSPAAQKEGEELVLSWKLSLGPDQETDLSWTVMVESPRSVVRQASAPAPWRRPGDLFSARGHDLGSALYRWVDISLQDLDGLRMSLAGLPDRQFLAAGAPWFFTLFGRDSLWAARFLLPLGTSFAEDTLHVLASLQAQEDDPDSCAQPGKIIHELRQETTAGVGAFEDTGMRLPSRYYGSIDATELWVLLFADAVGAGLSEDWVRPLIGSLRAALGWLVDYADPDHDGFLEYFDPIGKGLANQGWKDSGDSIRWKDGNLAQGPIALCEVQGYAYEAATRGADLLDRYGESGGPDAALASRSRSWAQDLRTAFNRRFWVEDRSGAYPAVALDKGKRPVDSLTSNIGHLLGTGILDEGGARKVVDRLLSDDLLSPYGIRTLAKSNGGFLPSATIVDPCGPTTPRSAWRGWHRRGTSPRRKKSRKDC